MLCKQLPLARAVPLLPHCRLSTWGVLLVLVACFLDSAHGELRSSGSSNVAHLAADGEKPLAEAKEPVAHVAADGQPAFAKAKEPKPGHLLTLLEEHTNATIAGRRLRLTVQASSLRSSRTALKLGSRTRAVGEVLLTMLTVLIFVVAGLAAMYLLTGGSVGSLRNDPIHSLENEAFAIYNDPRGQFNAAGHRSVDLYHQGQVRGMDYYHQGQAGAMDMYQRGRTAGGAAYNAHSLHAGMDAWKGVPTAAGGSSPAPASHLAASPPLMPVAGQAPSAASLPPASLPPYQAGQPPPQMQINPATGQRHLFCC